MNKARTANFAPVLPGGEFDQTTFSDARLVTYIKFGEIWMCGFWRYAYVRRT